MNYVLESPKNPETAGRAGNLEIPTLILHDIWAPPLNAYQRITLYECVDAELVKREDTLIPSTGPIRHSLYEDGFNSLMAALSSPRAQANTRIIWIRRFAPLQSDVSQILGEHFDIDPAFFQDGSPTRGDTPVHIPLPSQNWFFRIEAQNSGDTLRCVFFRNSDDLSENNVAKTAMVVMSFYESGPIINGLYYKDFHRTLAIERMSKDEIVEAEQNPVEFLYPHVKGMLAADASECHTIRAHQVQSSYEYSERGRHNTPTSGSERGPERVTLGELVHESLSSQRWVSRLSFCIDNLKRFNGETHKAKEIIGDFRELIDRVIIVRDWLRERVDLERDELNRQVSNLAIDESRKSIEQAVSVKRLTQLAFFFIPLSFVTSLFGMNVDEFGSDKGIKLWMFFVTSITLTAVVLLIWGFVSGKLESVWWSLDRRIHGYPKRDTRRRV
ncbi:Magnesium transport protein CorA, transmembrane region [Glarea lozoyensis ATCC 20868]|uniref:Magnesium transport protein CorA, transmembrane region n=1 Tax=Glarea lozoyensis (strain ATCC 20868 / MF5171) TaxID=1116229 RepID=S3DD12_GLAL2|nr:Magnesium transport protein CorA, transmembrane region [Glarea lozoyensis ATCC 20868]EPE35620.1 Magnesium transport protein CorA, transmembrane region [Glarea lozoyensis ATCC 20868]